MADRTVLITHSGLTLKYCGDRVRTVGLAGRDGRLRFRRSASCCSCASHGAKHMWSRLMWLGDVGRLAQAGVDWTAVMKLASETRCERPVLLGLLLAHDLLDAPVPENVLERARGERVVTVHARAGGRTALSRGALRTFELGAHRVQRESGGASLAKDPALRRAVESAYRGGTRMDRAALAFVFPLLSAAGGPVAVEISRIEAARVYWREP